MIRPTATFYRNNAYFTRCDDHRVRVLLCNRAPGDITAAAAVRLNKCAVDRPSKTKNKNCKTLFVQRVETAECCAPPLHSRSAKILRLLIVRCFPLYYSDWTGCNTQYTLCLATEYSNNRMEKFDSDNNNNKKLIVS